MKPPRKTPTKTDFYMGLALTVAQGSKDPNTQCGCVILDHAHEPISFGYNGPPKSMDDDKIDWDRPHKYPYIVHSEINAIRYAKQSLAGATLLVTARPCPACMLAIVSNGIGAVIYRDSKPSDGSSMIANEESWDLSLDIAKRGGLVVEKFAGSVRWLFNDVACGLELQE